MSHTDDNALRADEAQRADRRASLRNLLDRLQRMGLTETERDLLRQHVETETREADTMRAVAAGNKRHVQVMYAEMQKTQAALDRAREAARWVRRNYPGLTSVNDRLAAALDEPAPAPAATEATDRATRLDALARDILSTFVPTRDSTGMHITHHQAVVRPHEMRAWQDALDETEQP